MCSGTPVGTTGLGPTRNKDHTEVEIEDKMREKGPRGNKKRDETFKICQGPMRT